MNIQVIQYNEEVLKLYQRVNWIAYTQDPETLKKAFENSALVLGAFQDNQLVGLIRTVGDQQTIMVIQDVLVHPEYQRQRIGTALIQEILQRYSHVRQIQLCTDNTEKTKAFYTSLGFIPYESLHCVGFMTKR